MRLRTAVSKSMPVMPIAASPHMLMHSLSGLREFGAHRQPQAITQLRGLAPADVAVGVVGFQKGDSSSRGLPASWVMTVFGTSATDIRSAMTRYGDSGLSSLVRYGRHFAIHGSFSARMR